MIVHMSFPPHLTTSHRGLSHATHCVPGEPPRDPGKAIRPPQHLNPLLLPPHAHPSPHLQPIKFGGIHPSDPHAESGCLSDCVLVSVLALSLSHVPRGVRRVSCLCVTQQIPGSSVPHPPSGYMGISIYKTSLLIHHLLKGILVASKFE